MFFSLYANQTADRSLCSQLESSDSRLCQLRLCPQRSLFSKPMRRPRHRLHPRSKMPRKYGSLFGSPESRRRGLRHLPRSTRVQHGRHQPLRHPTSSRRESVLYRAELAELPQFGDPLRICETLGPLGPQVTSTSLIPAQKRALRGQTVHHTHQNVRCLAS